jgi:hypothetical protein
MGDTRPLTQAERELLRILAAAHHRLDLAGIPRPPFRHQEDHDV